MQPSAVKALVREAETAFASDPAYLIQMAEQASLIQYKRRVYAVRQEARDAEEQARGECHADPSVACANRSACGFGDCRFASAEHAAIHTAPRDEGTERAMPGTPYRLDDAIAMLMQLRGVTR